MTLEEMMAQLVSILQAGGTTTVKLTTLGEAAMTWLEVGGCEEMANVPCVVVGQRMVYFEDNVGPEGFQGVDLEYDEQVQVNMPQWMAVRYLEGKLAQPV